MLGESRTCLIFMVLSSIHSSPLPPCSGGEQDEAVGAGRKGEDAEDISQVDTCSTLTVQHQPNGKLNYICHLCKHLCHNLPGLRIRRKL